MFPRGVGDQNRVKGRVVIGLHKVAKTKDSVNASVAPLTADCVNKQLFANKFAIWCVHSFFPLPTRVKTSSYCMFLKKKYVFRC